MSTSLVLCESCHRHIRATEGACPFCRSTPPAIASRAVAVLAGAALVGALSHDASAQTVDPRLHMEHAPAQGYGAPPRPPFEPGFGAPDERPHGPTFVVNGPSSVVRVGFDRPVSGVGAVRAAIASRAPALERCMIRGPRGSGDASQRLVVVPWGAVTVRPTPGQRDVVSQCLFLAVRAALPRAPRGQGAMVSVRVEYTPRHTVVGRLPAPGASRCPSDVNRGCHRTGCPGNMVCDTRAACVPSSCGCDPATGQVTCTDDCGGGVCVPPDRVGQRAAVD